MQRKFRLTRSTDFKRVRRTGKSYAHPFVVLVVQASEVPRVRVGVTAGRSVGGAVQRNRAKRLLREAFRGVFHDGDHVIGIFKRLLRDSGGETGDPGAVTGLWVVLVARQMIQEAGSREVREELDHLLGHLK